MKSINTNHKRGARRRNVLLSYIPILHTLLICSGLFLCTSCKKGDQHTPEQIVCQAAEHYYQQLINGNYEAFAQGFAPSMLGAGYTEQDDKGASSLYPAYHQQLTDVAAHYAHQQYQRNGGITSARSTEAKIEEDSTHAMVYMELHFGDSTVEIVNIPMRHTDKGWRME